MTTATGDTLNYTYDAWGNILSAPGSMAGINPLRYRGYYYDSETGFYYLQSRYYDPANHRFINADSYASTGQGVAGTNMFAYCNNNPVRYVDSEGTEAELLEWWTGFMWWLCAIDGVLPFGDILYALGCVVLIIISFAVVDEAKDSFSELEHESDENTQIEDAGVSAPATPPNGNRNNKNDKNKKIESENNTPRNNQAQNKQARDAARRAGLDKYQREIFHREISGQGYTYQEMLEIAYEVRGLYSE